MRDMALIQELWYCEGHIMGLNIPGYTPFCVSGIDIHNAHIFARNKNILMPSGFYCRDVVTVLKSYNEGKAERCLVVCSAHLPHDSKDPPPQGSWGKSCATVKRKTRDGAVHQFLELNQSWRSLGRI
jgi:hypothetical protein